MEQGLGDSAGGFCAYAYAVGYVPRLGTAVHDFRSVFFLIYLVSSYRSLTNDSRHSFIHRAFDKPRRHLGFEYWANPSQRDEGFITWMVNDAKTARMSAAAVTADQGDDGSGVGDRLIPEEPMVRYFFFVFLFVLTTDSWIYRLSL